MIPHPLRVSMMCCRAKMYPICDWMGRAGLMCYRCRRVQWIHARVPAPSTTDPVDDAAIVDMLLDGRHSCAAIARMLGTHPERVRRVLHSPLLTTKQRNAFLALTGARRSRSMVMVHHRRRHSPS